MSDPLADILAARAILDAPGQLAPNTFILSDAVAKHLGGPDAIGGTYVRQPDGTYIVYPFDGPEP